jgi:ribosomal-protein-alanine N-acetyltransferase
MTSTNTPNESIVIESVTDAGAARKFLAPLCDEWTATGSFWNLESCLETMGGNNVLSAAAIGTETHSKNWVGWYLATCAGADCELLFIYTARANRGQGIANKLLNDLILRARATEGVESLFLEVRVSNTSAIRLYEKCGFVRQSIRPRYYSNGEDALVYRLSLRK